MAILVDQAKYNTLNAGNSTTEPLENGVFSKQIIALVLNNSIKDNCDEVNEAGITLDDTIQQEREAFHTIISRAGYKPATVDNQVSQSVITLISNTSTALTGNTRQMANPVSLQSGDFFNIFIDTENKFFGEFGYPPQCKCPCIFNICHVTLEATLSQIPENFH